MSTTLDRLGRAPSRRADDYPAARARLTLAVLWLAGLIASGLFSYLAEPAADRQGAVVSTPAVQTFDGHGKWTGY